MEKLKKSLTSFLVPVLSVVLAFAIGAIIMVALGANPGKALSREEILDAVWGKDYFGELKIVDVNIRRLRIKIEDDPQNPAYVTTVWGYGYKWGV